MQVVGVFSIYALGWKLCFQVVAWQTFWLVEKEEGGTQFGEHGKPAEVLDQTAQ